MEVQRKCLQCFHAAREMRKIVEAKPSFQVAASPPVGLLARPVRPSVVPSSAPCLSAAQACAPRALAMLPQCRLLPAYTQLPSSR